MSTSTASTALSHRDRAVLRAVAAGRCAHVRPALLIDGLRCADQFLSGRLIAAGLLDATAAGSVRLTATGRAALDAA